MEAILRHYQVPNLRRRQDQLQGRCPIHRGERDDSFRASLSQNVFQCFACQAHGNVLDFVVAMEGCSVREAALQIQEWFGINGRRRLSGTLPCPAAVERQLVRKKEGANRPLRFALTGLHHTHPYLAQRGVDRAIAVEFGIGFYSRPGLMSGRIVIPIHNGKGEIVAYAGRALDGGIPKYRLPGGFHKSLELYNLHRAMASGGQAGLPGVVALMGSSLSLEQEKLLVGRFERVILMLDGDDTGREATQTIRAKLIPECDVLTATVSDGTQPDQLSPGEIRELLFAAMR